ncbi:DEAD/DEAH box helicase family protein [Nocardiopsis dassonvillei]
MTSPAPQRQGSHSPSLILRPHQVDAVRIVSARLVRERRGKLIMATGTGKTITSAAVAAQLDARAVLVVVPSLPLLQQTATEWARVLGERLRQVIAVCSSSRVSLADCTSARTEVCTDPERLASLDPSPGTLVLTTYHSVPVLVEAHRRGVPRWDLVVVDEAHRSASPRHTLWTWVHDDDRVPARHRLYVTATPVVYKPRPTPASASAARHALSALSMDDASVYGQDLYTLSCARAIELGVLSEYRTVVSVVTSSEVAALIGEERLLRVGGYGVPAPMLAAQLSLLRAIATYDLRSVMTFHSRVDSARRFAATLPAALELLPEHERPHRAVSAHHIHGDTHLQARQSILTRLGDPQQRSVVVSSARVLSEGVDVPSVDCVMLVDPGSSTVQTTQRVGRGLRLHPGRTEPTVILVPILADPTCDVTNHDDALSPFAHVWEVISSLRSHDARVATDVDTAYAYRFAPSRTQAEPQDRAAAAGVLRGSRLPAWLTITGHDVDQAFAEAIMVRAVEATASPWWASFVLAQDFFREHGHCYPPTDYPIRTPSGRPLHAWLSEHRQLYRAGARLDAQQRQALESIKIEAPSPRTSLWARVRLALERVDTAADLPADLVARVNQAYREERISEEQAVWLREQGVPLHLPPRKFDRTIARLVAEHSENGLPKPRVGKKSSAELATMSAISRLNVAWQNNELEDDQKETLRAIGLDFDTTTFESMYQAIKKLREEGVDFLDLPPDQRLWISQRVSDWNRNKASEQRINRLKELGLTPDFTFVKHAWWKRVREIFRLPDEAVKGSRSPHYKLLDSYRRKWERLDLEQKRFLSERGIEPGKPMPPRFRNPQH